MLKTWPHLDEVFCNLTQRDRPFFCLWLQFTNSCANIEFFISHWKWFCQKQNKQNKNNNKKTIFDKQFIIFSQRIQLIFFLFGNTGKLVIETLISHQQEIKPKEHMSIHMCNPVTKKFPGTCQKNIYHVRAALLIFFLIILESFQ